VLEKKYKFKTRTIGTQKKYQYFKSQSNSKNSSKERFFTKNRMIKSVMQSPKRKKKLSITKINDLKN
jgi:hypothetical protein